VRAAGERVVDDDLVTRRDLPPQERIEHGAHRHGHRTEVNRDVLGLRELLSVRGEQGGRASAPP
jgi:hypothetical protein